MPRNADGSISRARFTSLKLAELSSVDRPAQPGALAVIMKRDDAPRSPAAQPSIMALAVAKYISEDDGAHTFGEVLQANEFDEKIWPMVSALSQSIRSIMGDTGIKAADKEAKVTQSVDEFLAAVRAISPEAATASEKRLAELISKKDSTMPKTIDELTAKVEELAGQLASANTLATAEKARADKAEGELATEKTAHGETRKALTEATDEVITVGGAELRKSAAGEANFSVAKALADERDMAKIEKRAETEFGHVAGTVAEKALVLKAAQTMTEDARKALDAILTSAETMAKGAFGRIGGGAGPSATVAKAAEEFDGKVAEIAKRDGISQPEAMTKARREHPELFDAMQDAA
jgi:polyhydroxyalkanoate synthesis regulator phasin